MINAVMIDSKDTVAVAIEKIEAGGIVSYMENSKQVDITALDDITIYYKVCVRDINKGGAISKYGEHIGIAACDIKIGNCVHVHNVVDNRENLSN